MKVTRVSSLTGVERTREIDITDEQWQAYCDGELIQNAMPNVSVDDREFIISGITPSEWETYFDHPDQTDEVLRTEKLECPNCGKLTAMTHPNFRISKSETVFVQDPDPHYEWEELYKCPDCGTLYLIKNGT